MNEANRSEMWKRTLVKSPETFGEMPRESAFWHATKSEVAAKLSYGQRKAEVLRWVRRQMGRRLTKRERHCVEMHFFLGLSYREMAKATSTNPAAGHRAVGRALRKLRQAVKDEGYCPPPPWGRR